MLIIGLTGSIATGKSSAANHFRDKNIPVFSADDAVHELYRGEAVPAIEQVFPRSIVDGQVDRMELSKQLLAHPEDFIKLEALIHPLVADKRRRFIDHQSGQGAKIIVLDIPYHHSRAGVWTLLFNPAGTRKTHFSPQVRGLAPVQRLTLCSFSLTVCGQDANVTKAPA